MADSVPSYCRRQGLSREKLFETNFLVKGRMPGDIRLGCAEKGEGIKYHDHAQTRTIRVAPASQRQLMRICQIPFRLELVK